MNEQKINLPELRQAFKAFFQESPAGQMYVQQINRLIQNNYALAEQHPENARDLVQRARGNREALMYIQGIVTEPKKPDTKGARVK